MSVTCKHHATLNKNLSHLGLWCLWEALDPADLQAQSLGGPRGTVVVWRTLS